MRMKFYSVFVIIVASCTVNASSQNSECNALQKAFVNIAQALALQNHLVSIVGIGDHKDNFCADFFASTAGIPHVLTKFKNDSERFEVSSSAILSLDSVESLITFNNRTILPRTFSTKQQLFIHCRDGTFDSISLIAASQLKNSTIQFEYFVIEEEKSIRLSTFVWYTPEKCDVAQLIDVNHYNKKLKSWKHERFKIDKFSNFHGCRINFLFHGGLPEFDPDKIDDKNKAITKCSGYTCALVKDFSAALNYTYHMNMWYFFDEPPILWPEIPFDLFVGSDKLNNHYSTSLYDKTVSARPIYHLEHFITVPPGEKFNGYEKLIMPFDEDTWMWLGITFVTAFVTIFVLRFVRRDIAYFVIGKESKTPALNVLRGFFGISQITYPRRNFARYLLMIFIIFSLVIRTAYQGVMFEFLQKEMRKPTVKTVEEMIDQNFTFYMQQLFKSRFEDWDLVQRGNIIDDWALKELYAAYNRTYIAGSKTAVFYHKDFNFVLFKYVKRIEPPKILEQSYMYEHRALLFPRFHFLFNIFDRKLQQYVEGDFIGYNVRDYIIHNKFEFLQQFKEPFAVLTLEELEAGFVVCMVPLLLSILVFGIELMPNLKNLVVFIFVFESYYELRESEQNKYKAAMKLAMHSSLFKRLNLKYQVLDSHKPF